jgi:predicted DNA-binding transcriptional regulator AlpA
MFMSVQKLNSEAPSVSTSETPTSSTNDPLMFTAELLRVLGLGNSTLYAWINAGYFKAPMSLGPNRSNGCARRAAWLRAEVYAWIGEQAVKPRTLGPKAKPCSDASQPA